jgi:hypothetical protein
MLLTPNLLFADADLVVIFSCCSFAGSLPWRVDKEAFAAAGGGGDAPVGVDKTRVLEFKEMCIQDPHKMAARGVLPGG